jgi:hypothetical protein
MTTAALDSDAPHPLLVNEQAGEVQQVPPDPVPRHHHDGARRLLQPSRHPPAAEGGAEMLGGLGPGTADTVRVPPHRRLRHTRLVGRPETRQIPEGDLNAIARFGAGAATNTADHPAGVSIFTTSSAASVTPSTRNPGSPKQRLGRPVPSSSQGSPRRCCLQTAVTMTGPPPRMVDAPAHLTPHPNAKSQSDPRRRRDPRVRTLVAQGPRRRRRANAGCNGSMGTNVGKPT